MISVKTHATKLWPKCEVRAFGSFSTGLSLPDSDIDVMVLVDGYKDTKSLVKKLSLSLKESGSILEQEEILSAKIPLLKITLKENFVSVDISFNVIDGCKAIEPIKELLKKYPQLRPLVLTIKAFLRQRKLNETYKGGIGSFLLIVMIVGFLQYQSKKKKLKEMNLGELLIGFFRFYGSELNHEQLGISIIGEGSLYKKIPSDQSLSIKNPQDQEADIGKCARQYNNVVKSFQYASDLLKYTSGSLAELIYLYPDRKSKQIPA